MSWIWWASTLELRGGAREVENNTGQVTEKESGTKELPGEGRV